MEPDMEGLAAGCGYVLMVFILLALIVIAVVVVGMLR